MPSSPRRTDSKSAPLPASRPSRAVVEAVRPVVDGGRFPAKAAEGELLRVVADVFTDGHDLVAAALRWRRISRAGGRAKWQETAMAPLGNDRFEATFVPDEVGRWEYDVVGWVDHVGTWRRDTAKKVSADQDVSVELQAGALLLDDVSDRADQVGAEGDAELVRRFAAEARSGDTSLLDDDTWGPIFFRHGDREPIAQFAKPLPIDVDPLHASFGAWYEFFPRSIVDGDGTQADDSGHPPTRHGTLAEARERLDYVADMGFDIVYLPPIHPVGVTHRKGRNNSTTAAPDDAGSPWGIGADDGGHTAVSKVLGTVDDVVALVDACGERGMELALDIAFQCSPDHPWVTEHQEWFVTRADGSIQYAENPPKKYQDIYPLDFESSDWRGLWTALADVFRFWIERGVRVFRVDNPHTKSFAYWEWSIAALRAEHPDVVFLAEAFTRPRVMERLAKIGFSQSYTYFAWRQAGWELQEYFEDLSTRTLDYFRPNAWPNTPDILTEQLQSGGRAGFINRAVLAATLSPSWGVYGPAFELMEHRPIREGSEEYLDSEKYQLRSWDLDRDDSLAPLLTRLNEIRRSHPAFRRLDTIVFHGTDNPGLLCFTKTDPTGASPPVIVVVNLDSADRQSGFVDIDLAAIGLPDESDYDVVDQLGGAAFRWHGNRNYVDLAPWSASAHIFSVRADEPATAIDIDRADPANQHDDSHDMEVTA